MDVNTILKMFIYALESTLICCVVVSIYCMNNHYTKKIQPEDLMGTFVLICLSGFRYEVGSDYTRYLQSYAFAVERFNDLHDLFNPETLSRYTYEVGYETLSVLVSRISNNPYAIFWTVAVILYIPLTYFCRKKTNDAHAAFATFILFGFWGLSLNIIKQAIAMMLVVCVYELIKKKKYVFAFLFSLIAVSFHTTSIVAIVAIVVIHVLKNKVICPTKRNLYILVIIGMAARFGTSILLAIIAKIGPLTKYIYYLDSEYTRINRGFVWVGAAIETLIVIFIVYIAIEKLEELKGINPDIEEIISIIMVGIPLSIVGISKQLWLANRFSKFFFLFLIVLIPALMGKSHSANRSGTFLFSKDTRLWFWIAMIGWHVLYSVLMLDNNFFSINSYLFL